MSASTNAASLESAIKQLLSDDVNRPDAESALATVFAQMIADNLPYTEYMALLTQSSTSAPTAAVLTNTLGVTPTLGYTSPGVYTITATGLFTSAKTVVEITNNSGAAATFVIVRTSADVCTITTDLVTFTAADNVTHAATNALMTATPVRIRVWK